MALYTTEYLKRVAQAKATSLYKSTARVLTESVEFFEKRASANDTFDIFLSHAFRDQEIILGIIAELENLKYSVYVDWRDDTQLDRTNVNKDTARILRVRMGQCRSLIFATTDNSGSSKWMPWELGYFDGNKQGLAAILPVKAISFDNDFSGQEYLGMYPYVVKEKSTDNKELLWVHENASTYITYDAWLNGNKPIKRS